MYTGIVVGSVVSTAKDEKLQGIKLLVVQMIENGKPTKLIVAADQTRQAGQDDFVYLIGSKEASLIFRGGLVPADAAIVGFVDQYNEYI
ncbi:MAG: ethanolamine utilization protein EutN [Firmicutes bacterium HGW-Firmicutes-9]|jgi:ethanolamine utilization protein EutN|nr:MAG: ethanolamine utilization protein EutN [Firmicutes bacterium HGW-Firmicutes-9]